MATNLVILFTFLVICALVSGAANEQRVVLKDNEGNMTKGGKSPQLADSKPQLTPLEQGMQPIFFITKYFLNNILQPDTRGPPDVLIQSVVRMIDNDMTVDELLLQFENNWQQISKYYVGFAVCIVIGLLFIIIMPIVGLCFCCCRICGNCGGDAGQMDPKFARCKHASYTVLLLVIATVMLACVVCAFVTNDLFHTQVTDKDRGYISNVNRSINNLEKYMDSTVQELKTDVGEKVDTGIDSISGMVSRTGSVVLDQLKIITEIGVAFENMTSLGEDVPRLRMELNSLSSSVSSAKQDADELRNSLTSVKNEIQNALENCQVRNCPEARDKANQLTLNVDLNKMPNFNQLMGALDQYRSLQNEVRDAKTKFDDYGTQMTEKMRSDIEEALNKLDNAKKQINSELNDLEAQIANISGQIGKSNNYLDMVPRDTVYNNIAMFVGVGLSCLFLLIVMLLYMGMTFGVCGERPYDDARFCNKGVGANFLMAGVGFMFLTSAVLMLVTLVLFLVGAPLQTEVCRHLIKPLKSPFVDKIDSYLNLGQFLYASSSDKLTIKDVLTNCENNTAIYVALKLNRTYDLESSIENVINKLDPQIQKLVDDIKKLPSMIVEIVPKKLNDTLTDMKGDSRFSENFDQTIAEVQKQITIDLATYIGELELLGIDSQQLNNAMTTLRGLNSQEVPNLRKKLSAIRDALESTKRINLIPEKIVSKKTENTIENKTAYAEQELSPMNQKRTVSTAADMTGQKFRDAIRTLATELQDLIENEVGRCRPLYDAYFTLVSATCEDVLNPFNSFWCAYGLCLLLFVPAIIFAVKLAGLYRKTDKYVGKPFETLGGSNVYPGDHIPLDDVRKPPPYRDARAHASPSSGYDNSSAPPLEYGQGMLDFEMPYAVPARKGLYPQHRDNRPLLDQQM